MSMKIQKGLVKDQGFEDTTCTYGTCDDGSVFYFIENGVLENGNIIANSNLKEAIGHTDSQSSLGIIDNDGNVLLPFENKSIKLVTNNLLLVERTTPSTPSVVAATNDRMNPLVANKLVTTAANVKDRINEKIGNDGRFIFNNQFSEAAIYDFNGNNVMNDYFSFIAMNDRKIFFCKNIMDYPVLEYVYNQEIAENTIGSEQLENVVQNNLDITNTQVSSDTVENKFVEESNKMMQNSNNDIINNFVSGLDSSVSEYNSASSTTDNSEENNLSNVESVNSEISSVENKVSDSIEVQKNETDSSTSDNDFQNIDNSLNVQIPITESIDNNFNKNDNDSDQLKNINDTEDNQDKSEIDSKEENNEIDEKTDKEFKFNDPDVVIEYANNVMKELIVQNKRQKDVINDQNERIEVLEDENKELNSQCDELKDKNDDLSRKVTRYENIIEKYVKRLTSLSEKVESQNKIISDQQKKLDTLEPQIAGREKLGNTVEEAMEILNELDDNKESFEDRLYTKRYIA